MEVDVLSLQAEAFLAVDVGARYFDNVLEIGLAVADYTVSWSRGRDA